MYEPQPPILVYHNALHMDSVIRCFKHSNAIEIRDEITFDFYMGLPHMPCCNTKVHADIPQGKAILVHCLLVALESYIAGAKFSVEYWAAVAF